MYLFIHKYIDTRNNGAFWKITVAAGSQDHSLLCGPAAGKYPCNTLADLGFLLRAVLYSELPKLLN